MTQEQWLIELDKLKNLFTKYITSHNKFSETMITDFGNFWNQMRIVEEWTKLSSANRAFASRAGLVNILKEMQGKLDCRYKEK